MIRFFTLGTFVIVTAGLVMNADAGGLKKSDSKVKATATATKIENGKQTVTITLDIEKGWYLYANPVGAEDFEGNKTNVSIKAKDKVQAKVKYPEGTPKVEKIGKEEIKISIYEDKVTIQAEVARVKGDTSPLQISIDVNSCNKGTCLPPGTVKLMVP